MTERDKMLAGELYFPEEASLTVERNRCADLCFAYNQILPSRREERRTLLAQILGGLGEGSAIQPPFHCDYGTYIHVGSHAFINYNCVILDCAPVHIGDRVLIAPNCGIYTAGHPLKAAVRATGLEFAKPVTIEDDVWIGGSVTILPGVKIGRGSVIGGGSVVVRDIPSGVVAAGNPCKVIRILGPEETDGGRQI